MIYKKDDKVLLKGFTYDGKPFVEKGVVLHDEHLHENGRTYEILVKWESYAIVSAWRSVTSASSVMWGETVIVGKFTVELLPSSVQTIINLGK